MVEMVLSFALPFLVSLAVAGVLRLSGASGAAVGRLGGSGMAAGFLAWWLWAHGLSPAVGEAADLAPHVMLGGLLAGGIADGWVERRPLAWGTAAVFGLVCLWALAGRPMAPADWVGQGLAGLAPVGVWLLVTVALGRRAEAPVLTPLLLLLVAAVGLAAVAAALGRGDVSAAALALAAATAGLLGWSLSATAPPSGWIVTLGGGGTLVTLTAALLAATPAAVVPVAVLALVFLAAPTAARLPAGAPSLAPLARALWLVAVAAVPAVLAGFLAQVAARVTSG